MEIQIQIQIQITTTSIIMSHLSKQYHHHHHQQQQQHNNNNPYGDDGREAFKKEMRELEEMLSKLNQTPSSSSSSAAATVNTPTRRRKGHGKSTRQQDEDAVKRTIYVSDIPHHVTEQQLAALFLNCGQVVDCRVCGDPNSILRFAFIEFTEEEGARNALSMAAYYPVRVRPSKTAIAPVNPSLLPKSEDERRMCARTIYCTNIDNKVTQAQVKLFFESLCGQVYRLRMLGDRHHSTRIAFVEFVKAESAIAALKCSGAVLGCLPIRVSPSKTPIRVGGHGRG